jgi:hypothetical protein
MENCLLPTQTLKTIKADDFVGVLSIQEPFHDGNRLSPR